MKKLIRTTGIIFFLINLSGICLADYKDEILKLGRIDMMPLFVENAIVKQVSSYDTTGGNDDGFSGRFSFLRKENGNLVIADLRGPGIIQRIWTPTPTRDTIQFYFDGESQPRIELPFIDLFSGIQFPFIRPIVGNEVGGYYSYIPVPYNSSCKIVFKGERMQFIQIQYRELMKGSTMSFPEKFSVEEEKALYSAVETWKTAFKTPSALLAQYKQVKTTMAEAILKPGSIKTVFSKKGGGRIVGIEVEPGIRLNSDFKDLIIRAAWDGEKVAAINSPLGDFFGYAFGEPTMQSMLAGVKAGSHYNYIPMPFDKEAVIELEYLKHTKNVAKEIPVSVKIYYTDAVRTPGEGKLYAEWRRINNPPLGQPYPILDKKGRGHYVGTLLQAQGLNHGSTGFFEGDDRCYVDGELRLHGTGSEDYFNGGWYALPDRWDQAFNLPLHGCLGYSIPLARTGGYRFFLTDKIPFEREISLSIEHGPVNNNTPVDYTSIAFYYCDTPPAVNNVPPAKALHAVVPPQTQEYLISMLPVKALGRYSTISNEMWKDAAGRNYNIYKLQGNEGFAKFELEVQSQGVYKLYLTYIQGPDCTAFEVSQRQIPVKDSVDGFSPGYRLVEKEYIGSLDIREGTNTISIALLKDDEKPEANKLMLHRVFLERVPEEAASGSSGSL